MKYAPVIIPTLCRSTHFIRLVESLKINSWAKYTDVYIGLDYPPAEKYQKGHNEICAYLDAGDFSVFASFNIGKRDENLGVYRNYLELRKEIEKYDRYIYLEDDNEVSPNFLEYMDKCLEQFENNEDIIAVSGYCYPVKWEVSENANCFKQDFCASMWGMGWWKNKEAMVNADILSGKMLKDIDSVIKKDKHLKMIDAALSTYIPASVAVFNFQKKWMLFNCDLSVRPYLAVYDKYIISPVVSKVRNHGFDGSGLYCQSIDSSLNGLTAETYNYQAQELDYAKSFDIRLNDLNSMEENRRMLNAFDCRSDKEMKHTRILLWLMTHIGVWAAIVYSFLCVPRDAFKIIKGGFLRKRSV